VDENSLKLFQGVAYNVLRPLS